MTTALPLDDMNTTLEAMCDLINNKGDPKKAYSLAVKLGRLENPPTHFLRYMALAAFYSGFHEEAFRISKRIVYELGVTVPRDLANHSHYRRAAISPTRQGSWMASSPKEASRVAIIFTGLFRTFDRAYLNILNKLITPNNATVFLLCDTERSANDIAEDIEARWGHCGGVTAQDGRPSDFNSLTDYLLKTQPHIQPDKFPVWMHPCRIIKGGSILEYYQYKKGYELMLEYERKHDISFDVVIRSRLDIIFGNEMGILDFFNIRHESPGPQAPQMSKSHLTWQYFRTMGNPAIAAAGDYRQSPHVPTIQVKPPRDIAEAIAGNQYIWALGNCGTTFGRRHAMGQLSFLCHSYGKYASDRPLGCNSESQFALFCVNNNINLIRLPEGKGTAYCSYKNLAQGLLENPEDEIDKDIIYTILRPPGWGGFI